MKTIGSIIFFITLSFSSLFASAFDNAEWKAILQSQLSELFSSETFSVESVKVDTDQKQLSGTGTFFSVSGIHFSAAYSSPESIASFQLEFPAQSKISVQEKGMLKMAGQSLSDLIPGSIAKAIYLHKIGFTVSKVEKSIENLGLWFNSPLPWDLLPGNSLTLQDISLNFNIDYPTDKQKRKLKANLKGLSHLGSTPLELEADISQKKEDLTFRTHVQDIGLKAALQAMVGQSIFQGIPVPNAVIDLQLSDGTLSIKPYQENATITAQSNLGAVDAWMQRTDKKNKDLDYVVTISPPAGFKLSKLNNRLSGLDGIDLSGQKIVLTSEEKDKKESGKIPSLAQMSAGIKRGCNLLVKLDVTKLRLEHLLQVKELILSSPLSDQLTDVVLEAEIDKELFLGPSAKLSKVLFRLQPAPQNFAIALVGVMDARVSKDNLTFKGGMELVMASQTLNFMSVMEGNWNNPLGAQGLVMSKVGLQLGGSFGGAAILPNLAFSGELKIGRFNGAAALAFDTRDPTRSMLSAEIKELFVSDIMQTVVDKKVLQKIPREMQKVLEGIRFNDIHLEFVPQPLRVLEKNYDPGFRMGGNVDIMGVNGFGNMEIDYTNGLLAQGEVDPIDLGAFKLTGAGKNKRPGFIIDLRMNQKPKVVLNGLVSILGMQAETEVEVLPNGFSFDLGGKVFNVFNGKVMVSASDMERLGSMQTRVQMEQDLFGFVDQEVVKYVENQVGEAIKKLSAGQKKISDAQAKVRELDRAIDYQRDIVRKAQSENRAKYEKAQRDVTNAQKKVNGINGEINKLKKKRDAKKAWEVVDKTAINTQIAGLVTARGIAWTALEGYKKILGGMKLVNSNPDIDPRVASLIASKNTAIGTLELAKGSLEALKLTLGFTGKVATFVIDKGTDALINVRKADFAGHLGSVSGGAVHLNMQLEWMNKPMDLKVDFDFMEPLKMITSLGKRLLEQ